METTEGDWVMLLAAGSGITGHGSTAAGALAGASRGPASQRLLRRLTAATFLAGLVGIGLLLPML